MPTRPSLYELQKRFMAALFDAKAPGPTAWVERNGLSAEARLRIYRRSGKEIHAAALRTSYPAVLALVGKEWFDQTAAGYRSAYPPDSGNLQQFGSCLGDYLETLPACRDLPYLPDVARLEWLRQQTILAVEPGPIAAEALIEGLKNADDAARIALHPSVHWLGSRHRILTIWGFAMQPSSEQLKLDGVGENVVLWREGDAVAMAAPDPASFACITALALGRPLRDACADATALDTSFDLALCIGSLLQHGLMTGIRTVAAPREESHCHDGNHAPEQLL